MRTVTGFYPLNKYGHVPLTVERGGYIFGLRYKRGLSDKAFDVLCDGEVVGEIKLESLWKAHHINSNQTETFAANNKRGAVEWVARQEVE